MDGTSMDGKMASGGGLGGGVSVQALGKYGTRDEGDKANGGTLIEERGQRHPPDKEEIPWNEDQRPATPPSPLTSFPPSMPLRLPSSALEPKPLPPALPPKCGRLLP